MWLNIFYIFCGAGFGALLRWFLGLMFNSTTIPMPMGTLFANLLGGFLIGITMVIFSHFSQLPTELKLGLTTGFLGGLTTFSTFSSEVVSMLLLERYSFALITSVIHLGGSLFMTYLGIKITKLFL